MCVATHTINLCVEVWVLPELFLLRIAGLLSLLEGRPVHRTVHTRPGAVGGCRARRLQLDVYV